MITWRKYLHAATAAVLLPLVAWAGLTTQNVRNMSAVVTPDTTPNAFSFTDQTDVAISSTITSSAVAITGINASITCSATSGTIDKNSAGTFSSSQSIDNNDTVRARHTSSASNSTTVNTPVTCGGVSDTFSSTTVASGGSEFVGSYNDFDLEAHPTYRIDMAEQDYPTFLTAGATHTYEATGAWDGGPSAKLTPPLIAQHSDGYSALGGFQDLWKGGTLAVQKLNIRWEASFGSTFVTNAGTGTDYKWVIVMSYPTLGNDGDSALRPMLNWQKPSGNNVFQFATAGGTFKQFNPTPPPNDFGPDITRTNFFLGPTAGTLSGKPIIGPNTWLTFEMEIVTESTGTYPNGSIRGVVTDRSGTVLTDQRINFNYDTNWTMPTYIAEVQVIGGFYNASYTTVDANTYQRITAPTFAIDHVGLLGTRAGFIQ